MNGLPVSLSLEFIAAGLVGLLVFGALIKKVFDGYIEANKGFHAQKNNPLYAAMASTWDENQRERFMLLMERLVKSQEDQAESLSDLTNRQSEEMRDQIRFLVEKLGEKERVQRRRPTTKSKPRD